MRVLVVGGATNCERDISRVCCLSDFQEIYWVKLICFLLSIHVKVCHILLCTYTSIGVLVYLWNKNMHFLSWLSGRHTITSDNRKRARFLGNIVLRYHNRDIILPVVQGFQAEDHINQQHNSASGMRSEGWS